MPQLQGGGPAVLSIVYCCSYYMWVFLYGGPCFVMQYIYLVSFLVLHSSSWGDSWLLYFIVFWMSFGCYRSLLLPHGVMG